MDSIDEQNRDIIMDSYVDVYVSGYLSKIQYPYLMGNVAYDWPAHQKGSESYIMDSAIGKDEYDGEDVIAAAEKVNADVIVAKDYMGDAEGALDAAEEMFEMTDLDVIVPIQSGDEGHAYWAERAVERFGTEPWAYGIGGVKDEQTSTQIETVTGVRERVGDGYDLHLFGGGMSKKWVRAIREQPSLLDSLDMKTPLSAAKSGKIVKCNMEQRDIGNLRGTNSTIRAARIAELSAINFNYMISPHPREEDVEDVLSQ